MIKVGAELGKISGYAGAVSGILTAIGSPKNKSRFVSKYMDRSSDAFMTDTVAANEAGTENIRHMFDWGSHGQISDKPLFKLMKMGRGAQRYLTFDFLPSTTPVPLPSVANGTLSGATLGKLRPHIFREKALVMETMESVTISPKNARALFIPAADQPRGYIMTSKPVTINPGGNSTGGFVAWWESWFSTRGQAVITESTKLTEQYIATTGQTVIRDITTGRFAIGEPSTFAYASAQARAQELMNQAVAVEYNDG